MATGIITIYSKSFHIYNAVDQEAEHKILTTLRRIDGVRSARGNFQTKSYTITFTEDTSWAYIRGALASIGYTPEEK
jgi:hypothetical protein